MQQALLIIEALKDQFFSSAGCLNRSDLPLSIGLLIASFVVGLSYDTHATPIISEFLAINDSVHADEDGEFSDWLEIYNPDAETVELGGYFLSDDPDNLVKWRLPDTALDPGARLIIFASGKDRKNANLQLHTNFSLSGQGEYLALTEPDGTTVTSEYSPAFPVQKANVSYGMGIAAGAVSQKKLIVTGGSARFHVPRAELAQDWRVPEFDDKAWDPGVYASRFRISRNATRSWRRPRPPGYATHQHGRLCAPAIRNYGSCGRRRNGLAHKMR